MDQPGDRPYRPKLPKRKDLAAFVGRAIVLPEFYALLVNTPKNRKDIEDDLRFHLTDEEWNVIKDFDFAAIERQVADLRDLLPLPNQSIAFSNSPGW